MAPPGLCAYTLLPLLLLLLLHAGVGGQLYTPPGSIENIIKVDISNMIMKEEYRPLLIEWIATYFKNTDAKWNSIHQSQTYKLTSTSISKVLLLSMNTVPGGEQKKETFMQDIFSARRSSSSGQCSQRSPGNDSKKASSAEGKGESILHKYRKERRKKPSLKVDGKSMEAHLRNVFNMPRNHEVNATLKDAVKIFLAKKFYDHGLLTVVQVFVSSLFQEMYSMDSPEGYNIIGILPGRLWGTSRDRILVIGAHYDTVPLTKGYNDNGSGIVAMLEVIRTFREAGCTLQYSIIFVAFDLEEYGSHGCLHFIRDFLIPKVFVPFRWPHFQGAVILDSLMNYNETKSSQYVPPEWSEAVPDEEAAIRQREYKGDFLSILGRRNIDDHLSEVFVRNWKAIPNNSIPVISFHLDLPGDLPQADRLLKFLNFLRSDHARFWYRNSTFFHRTMSAILITDTGPFRGVMKKCYHKPCDGLTSDNKGFRGNIPFLVNITQTLVNTLKELTNAKCFVSVSEMPRELYDLHMSQQIPYDESAIDILKHWNASGIL